MKIKVKLLGNVSLFQYEGKVYKPGDVFVVDEKNFVSYIMVKLDAPAKQEVEPVSQAESVTVVEPTDPSAEQVPAYAVKPEVVADEPKKTRRKTKF